MAKTTHKDVTCPFCSLLCDDLVIDNDGGRLGVRSNGCSRARRGFERAQQGPAAAIRGRRASLDEAVTEAAALLRRARRPLISGLGSDVAGSRAAMALAERCRAVIDHCTGDAALRNLLLLQEQGWIMTTLTEVRNRADFILFVGTDAGRWPRFFERCVWNDSALFLAGHGERGIAYLGHRLNTRAGVSPAGTRPLSVSCPPAEIAVHLSVLLALLKAYEPAPRDIPRRRLGQLRDLAGRLHSAAYPVLVWAPGELDTDHGELTVEAAAAVIRELNRSGRAAGLSLAGDHGTASFMNVCTWQSGYPLRVSYRHGAPEYDPWHFAGPRLLQRQQADLLLWIAAWGFEPPVPGTGVPTIVLGGAGTEGRDADVFIPVGTPGVDHAGNLFRTDSVVNLPLRGLRDTPLPNAAAVLQRLEEALRA